jgi:DNA-binding LacI/PurR family transcriptional regulator
MRATKKMVAQRAGVSHATVSYVLNKSKYVSPELTKRVEAAVKELNYVPDIIARSMHKKESKMLCVIANGLTNSMYGEIVMEFEKEAVKRGFATNVGSGVCDLSVYVETILSRRIDGVFFTSSPKLVAKKDVDILFKNNVAVTFCNHILPEEERVNRLDLDYRNGMEQAVDYLLSLGHKNIGYLNGLPENYTPDVKCETFKKAAAEKLGRKNPPIVFNDFSETFNDAEGYVLMERLLQKDKSVTAVICVSDMVAYGAVKCLKDKGISVPGDISIVGFENLTISNFIDPPLTSLSFDRNKFAEAGVESLLNTIQNNTYTKTLLPMELVIRKSAGRCGK